MTILMVSVYKSNGQLIKSASHVSPLGSCVTMLCDTVMADANIIAAFQKTPVELTESSGKFTETATNKVISYPDIPKDLQLLNYKVIYFYLKKAPVAVSLGYLYNSYEEHYFIIASDKVLSPETQAELFQSLQTGYNPKENDYKKLNFLIPAPEVFASNPIIPIQELIKINNPTSFSPKISAHVSLEDEKIKKLKEETYELQKTVWEDIDKMLEENKALEDIFEKTATLADNQSSFNTYNNRNKQKKSGHAKNRCCCFFGNAQKKAVPEERKPLLTISSRTIQ